MGLMSRTPAVLINKILPEPFGSQRPCEFTLRFRPHCHLYLPVLLGLNLEAEYCVQIPQRGSYHWLVYAEIHVYIAFLFQTVSSRWVLADSALGTVTITVLVCLADKVRI
jgi:hypothetical protein